MLVETCSYRSPSVCAGRVDPSMSVNRNANNFLEPCSPDSGAAACVPDSSAMLSMLPTGFYGKRVPPGSVTATGRASARSCGA